MGGKRPRTSTGESSGEPHERGTAAAPNVVGLAQTPALRRLRAAGFAGTVAYRTSDEPAGRVIEQSAIDEDRIRVVVSSGAAPDAADVPDVRGDEEDAARQVLEDAGFRVDVIEIGDGTTVQDQQPRAGVTSYRGAVVTLFVG